MMHILVIPSWYPENSTAINGSFFREQTFALKKAGFKVGVLTPQLRSITSKSFLFGKYGLEFDNDNEVPTYRVYGAKLFPFSNMLNLLYWEFLGLWAFRKYVSNHGKPDIIHVHSMIYGAAWAKAINSKYQVPYIITEHSTEFQLATISTKLIKYFAKVCTHSSGLFAVSTALSMKLSNIFSSSHLSWKVIPNLVSDVFFDDNLLTPNELISSPFVFINIGSLLKKKGQDILIRAFHLAFHEDRTTILKIAGTGPEKGNLLSLAKTLSISDQIEFLGEVSRVRVKEELKGSNCFVLSSTYETFGVVLIEALAQGLPVVSTACGGAQDIVREGKDGYLVPINDVESLAQALIKLKNQILLFDLKEISNSCKERFSSDAYVMNYQEAYKKALV